MKLNNSGHTLIGVMVAAGIAAIILSAQMTIMSDLHKQVHLVEQKQEAIELEEEIRYLLKNPTDCVASLGTAMKVSPGELKAAGAPMYQVDVPRSAGVRIASYSVAFLFPVVPLGPPVSGRANLNVHIDTGEGSMPLKSRDISMGVTFDPATNLITACNALSDSGGPGGPSLGPNQDVGATTLEGDIDWVVMDSTGGKQCDVRVVIKNADDNPISPLVIDGMDQGACNPAGGNCLTIFSASSQNNFPEACQSMLENVMKTKLAQIVPQIHDTAAFPVLLQLFTSFEMTTEVATVGGPDVFKNKFAVTILYLKPAPIPPSAGNGP